MNNLPKHHGAGLPDPEARGSQRVGIQCSCIGCIGLRPALSATPQKMNITVFVYLCEIEK